MPAPKPLLKSGWHDICHAARSVWVGTLNQERIEEGQLLNLRTTLQIFSDQAGADTGILGCRGNCKLPLPSLTGVHLFTPQVSAHLQPPLKLRQYLVVRLNALACLGVVDQPLPERFVQRCVFRVRPLPGGLDQGLVGAECDVLHGCRVYRSKANSTEGLPSSRGLKREFDFDCLIRELDTSFWRTVKNASQ